MTQQSSVSPHIVNAMLWAVRAKNKIMIDEKTKNRLQQLHEQENSMNKEMGKIGKQIFELEKKKKKIAKRISGNMKFRNELINKL